MWLASPADVEPLTRLDDSTVRKDTDNLSLPAHRASLRVLCCCAPANAPVATVLTEGLGR